MGLFAAPGSIIVNAFTNNPPTGGIVQIGVNRNITGVIACNASYGVAVSGYESNGQIILTFNRMYGSVGVLHMSYSTSPGTATPGVDYTAVSGVVDWAAGSIAAKTVTIPLLAPS